ncbi:hypothetical protein BX265_1822 [Streptomyces sp. TLI_235]|nr:hypothetical protein [Streptomyces sp. TLI_235]PBC77085.1 hypothetical protein BX265_1822 [Streptomyces sp. TLI_235]
MKAGTHTALAELCSPYLLRQQPQQVLPPRPDAMPDASCAVYAAIDDRGSVCYVGSVCRPGDTQGLASHVAEYLDNLPKTAKWTGLYVFPLRPDTPEAEVRRIGGDIAGWLLPYDRERWPRLA